MQTLPVISLGWLHANESKTGSPKVLKISYSLVSTSVFLIFTYRLQYSLTYQNVRTLALQFALIRIYFQRVSDSDSDTDSDFQSFWLWCWGTFVAGWQLYNLGVILPDLQFSFVSASVFSFWELQYTSILSFQNFGIMFITI